MNAGELKKAKRDVRRSVLAARDALSDAERIARTAAIHDRFLALPEVVTARAVMLSWAFGSEIATQPLIERLHERGVRVALPRIAGQRELDAVAYVPGDSLRETSFGAQEPVGGEVFDPIELDVVVTPGVAFDATGHRVGYGGGFYDRFLLRTGPSVSRIALAYDLQVVDDLPAGGFDLPINVVVTETRVLRLRPTTSST